MDHNASNIDVAAKKMQILKCEKSKQSAQFQGGHPVSVTHSVFHLMRNMDTISSSVSELWCSIMARKGFLKKSMMSQ